MPEDFAHQAPTPVQSTTIPIIRNKRNCLICAPTGSGKTLAFLLPIVEKLNKESSDENNVLILQPSKELALQTFQEIEKIVAKNSELNSKVRAHNLIDVQPRTLKKFHSESETKVAKPNILLTTPNKLIHLLKENSKNVEISKIFNNYLKTIRTLVIDESDQLFEETHQKNTDRSFRTQLATIFTKLSNFSCHFFSATYSNTVEKWCETYLDNFITVSVGTRNTANNKIEQKLMFCENERHKLLSLTDILLKEFKPPILIFVQNKYRVDELYKELCATCPEDIDHTKIGSIHSDLNNKLRSDTIEKFRNGDKLILISTELLGRGMDFVNVGLVINYDIPTSPISYIHRIGRTARGNASKGHAITLFTPADKHILRTIGGVMQQAGCEVPEYIMKLKKLNNKERKRMANQSIKRDDIRFKKKKRKVDEKSEKLEKPVKSQVKKSKNK